jgi:hypothetical protein
MNPVERPKKQRKRIITIADQQDDSDTDSDGGIEEDFKNANQEIANFETLRRTHIGDSSSCWLCKYKFRPDNMHTRDPVLKKMVEQYNLNVGTIPPEELAVIIQSVYENDYRKKELERGNLDVMVMKVETVIRHLRFHMFTYKQTLDDTIQDMILMENELKNASFVNVSGKDGSHRKLPIEKNLNIYLKLVQQKTATVVAAANQQRRNSKHG